MDWIIDLLVPSLLCLLMLLVGLGLDRQDFQELRSRKRVIFLATLGQVLLLPLLAAGLAAVFEASPHIAIGLVLVAACPGGALSNYYCHLAGANVALSIALTSAASLASLFTLPVAASMGLALVAESGQRIPVPARQVILQLLFLVLLPIAVGMICRARWPARVDRWFGSLNRLGIAALIGLITLIFFDQAHALSGELSSVIALAIAFTVFSFALGAAMGRILQQPWAEIVSLGLEYSIRNLAIMALVAISIFDRPEYLLFGAVFLVVQTPIVVVATMLLRSRRALA